MNRYPASYAHGSFGLNGHLYADGTLNQANASNTVTIDNRSIEPTYREGRDAYHLATGGSLGRVHKGMTLIRLDGRIVAPLTSQEATVSDRERAMLAAFDPDACYRDSPSTDGAYAFDFSEPTGDTATYPTGLIPLRYYARPMGVPAMNERLADGGVRRYALGLIAPDPRCYEQTEQTLVLSGATWTGNLVNRGTVPAPLKLTIAFNGASVGNFTLTLGTQVFGLDLSGTASLDTVVVVMETCGPYGRGRYLTKNGVEAFGLKNTGPSSWLSAPLGTTACSISDATHITSVTLSWHPAWA
jgi:hypothetical protein